MLSKLKRVLAISFEQLQKLDSGLATELEKALLERHDSIPDDLVDAPLGQVPMVLALMESLRLDDVIDLAALSGPAGAALHAAAAHVEALDEPLLRALVEAKTLVSAEAMAVGQAVERYLLCDDDHALATAIGRVAGGQKNERLAMWRPTQWLGALSSVDARPPVGATLAAVAATLARRLEVLYPVWALLGRQVLFDDNAVRDSLDVAQILAVRNPRRWDGTYASLDLTDVKPEQRVAVEAAWKHLVGLIRGNPGLALGALFDDHARTSAARAADARSRINAFIAALSTASGPAGRLDVLGLDLSSNSKDWARFGLTVVPEPTRSLVAANIRGFQRMRVVAGDLDTATLLMQAGYASAHQIARRTLPAFAASADLGTDVAQRVWSTARRLSTDTALYVSGLADQLAGAADPAPTRPVGSVARSFATLEGYRDLFGNQAFCDCAHCASILGPAAYFVDLMEFVKAEVDWQGVAPGHTLHDRRPDLWTTPLTCEATTALVPTLTLVNEILENDIATRLDFAGPRAADRTTLEDFVYHSPGGLGATTRSFAQPFAVGLTRTRALLGQFEIARTMLGEAVCGSGSPSASVTLGLSTAWINLITIPRTTLPALSEVYGVTFTADPTGVAAIDASVLAAAMRLDRATLGALTETWFVGRGGPRPTIDATRRNNDSVQNDIENVNGLTVPALDRMHRLSRLAAALGTSVATVDRQLQAAGDDTLSTTSLNRFAALAALTTRFGDQLDDDDAVALIGAIDTAIADRRYNRGTRFEAERWPNADAIVLPALLSAPATARDGAAARLAAGLGLSSGATLALVRFLAPALAQEASGGFDPDASDETARYFIASAANLALLERHARVTRLLGVSVAELIELIKLAELGVAATIADVVAIVRAHDAWQLSGRSLDELAVATGRTPRSAPAEFDPAKTSAAIYTGALAALVVDDALFATALGLPAEASRQVIAANPDWFAFVGETRVLAGAVDLDRAPLTIPPTATVTDGRLVTEQELRAVLITRSVRARIVRALATATRRGDDEIVSLLALSQLTVSADIIDDVLRPSGTSRLGTLVAAVLRIAVATRGWAGPGLALLAADPTRFGPGSWPTLVPTAAHPNPPWFTFAQATALGRGAARNGSDDSADRAVAQAPLVEVIAAFDPATATFAATVDERLAALLRTEPATIASLRGTVPLPSGALAALDRLALLVEVCRSLNADGSVVANLASDDDRLQVVAAAAIDRASAVRADSDPTTRRRLDDAHGQVREQCRDALVDFLLRAPAPPPFPSFRDVNALADHFLIDVAAGGCNTTSRVVAITNAVQEYVTRITLGLELATSAPTPRAIVLSAAGTESWDWRRAYRVWEANRKVFLWPENYLEPSLRDDKTALFAALEDALGQGDLDESSILTAYATYLHGLDQLARLRIAGAYHDKGVDADGAPRDVLHLIGVTADEPTVFHYRSVTDLATSDHARDRGVAWSDWQPLDLSIPSRVVSPVVFQGRLHLLWAGVKTRAAQKLAGGQMDFSGYLHTLSLSMATLQAHGQWGAAQGIEIPELPSLFLHRPGVIYEAVDEDMIPAYGVGHHREPRDGYTLSGASWLGVWPTATGNRLTLTYRDFRASGDIDLIARLIGANSNTGRPAPSPQLTGIDGRTISAGRPTIPLIAPNAFANLVADRSRVYILAHSDSTSLAYTTTLPVYQRALAEVREAPESLAVAGSPSDIILKIADDLVHLRARATSTTSFIARRLSTTVTRNFGRVLFEHGIDGLLATAHQLSLAEAPLPMTVVEPGAIIEPRDARDVNFHGPFGVYLRELFFHIPLLVANSLAARGRYADARRWFHRVFDPTSTETIDVPATVPADERLHRALDRVWRYRELRALDPERARAILTDAAALAAYRDDPFNPHAIARRRLTAYQRYAFARYVDNLLEWGDALFAQFTRETVEEARLLYQLASELLGARPARLGDCGTGSPVPHDYQTIERLLDPGSAMRTTAETEVAGRRVPFDAPPTTAVVPLVSSAQLLGAAADFWPLPVAHAPAPPTPTSYGRRWMKGRNGPWAPTKGMSDSDTAGLEGEFSTAIGAPAHGSRDSDTFASSLLAQFGPIFCVPVNKTLIARWDRVEDRLWKIRHCMDLEGNRRELALFAPELDPMNRVAATALGLTPDDLVPELAREVPPYRFLYLIERAKGFASSLAGFGGALLGALERRDNEALSIVRQQQGLAMARLTRRQREVDLESARESMTIAEAQIASTEYRRDYYDRLLTDGRSADELAELSGRKSASDLNLQGAMFHGMAGVVKLIPEINAPWSVSNGGQHFGGALESIGDGHRAAAAREDANASLRALSGSYARRDDSWRHQLQLAKDELVVLTRQRRIAELRVRAADNALLSFDESIAQLEDVLAFERARVTNLALHTHLADGLRRLYRLAYGHALALARLAERAYRYERGDDVGGLAGDYWDARVGGLLAGERLLSDLQALDRRFLETHHREFEIDQPFPLTQLDPAALITLRTTGACEFTVPEVAFDLVYPGHWKRRLRAVRLTIPCVTGPYVNIGATLTLLASQVRPAPGAALADVPRAHGTTIATSSAQADGGVFELSFRDERYLPFEGQGAVSTWRLELPSTVRAFDYASITDVVVSLAYSARPDATRRALVEGPASRVGSLLHHHRQHPSLRIVSARQDLASSFVRVLRAPLGTPIPFALTRDMLPPIFRGRAAEVVSFESADLNAGVALRLADDVDPGSIAFTIDGVVVTGFVSQPAVLGGTPYASVAWPTTMTWTGSHTIAVTAAGALGGIDDTLDPAKILDVLLLLPIRLASGGQT